MEKIQEIRKYLKMNLSPKRYEHSLGVENTSVLIALKNGVNAESCALAGLSHDICREMPELELVHYSEQDHINPVLLHGSAGAKFLKERFHIYNESILNAVKHHTSGSHHLDDIGKTVFAADYLEPGRTHISKDERDRLFILKLNDMVLEIATQTKSYLELQGLTVEKGMDSMILELRRDEL